MDATPRAIPAAETGSILYTLLFNRPYKRQLGTSYFTLDKAKRTDPV